MGEGRRRVKLAATAWLGYQPDMAEKQPSGREARLAAALRANLARRKALSRSLGESAANREDSTAAQADIEPAPDPEA